MSELTYNQVREHLARKTGRDGHVYLVHGELALVDQCVEWLIGFLLEGAPRELCCQSLDGLMENIPEMLAQINTFSLNPDPRVVVFKDAKLFESQGDQQRLVGQIVEAVGSDQLDRAARAFLSLCGRLALSLESAVVTELPEELQPLASKIGVDEIGRLLNYCKQHGWSVQLSGANLDALLSALERGFPPRHSLVITVYAKAPKNRKLYKAIEKHGVIVDCSVPEGQRRADKMTQEKVLRQTLDEMLVAARKKITPQLIGTLIELTGFDLPVFRNNIERLIAFTGARAEITAEDIHALLHKTKIDPLYELTNAMADRNFNRAVGCLGGLLKAEWHPLQIIAALSNQVRKLLVAKDFVTSPAGDCWSAGLSYARFQSQVLPIIERNDVALGEQVTAWTSPQTGNPERTTKSAETRGGADLALAANPRSPFPIYQILLKSENFAIEELVEALQRISAADIRLKSTGQDPTQVLVALILTICKPSQRRMPAVMAGRKKETLW